MRGWYNLAAIPEDKRSKKEKYDFSNFKFASLAKYKTSHEDNKKRAAAARKAVVLEKKRREDASVNESYQAPPTQYVEAPSPHPGYNDNYYPRNQCNDNYNQQPPMADSYARRTQQNHYDDGRGNNNYHPSCYGGRRGGRGGCHW